MKIISEALAKWQLERLEAHCESLKARAKSANIPRRSLLWEHIDIISDNIDEAIGALRYNKFEQASNSCQEGFVQAGLAELLLRYGHKVDNNLSKFFLLSGQDKLSVEEETVSFLSNSLTQMKLAIEYTNCGVSKRAQATLDQAMGFYNSAIEAIKLSEPANAKYRAQAGLLQVHLAGEFISADNQMALPGWRGLSNPVLGSPLRRATELISLLVESKILLRNAEKEAGAGAGAPTSVAGTNVSSSGASGGARLDDIRELKSDWELAYHQYVTALNSLAVGSVAHAQALTKSALTSCREVHDRLAAHESTLSEGEIAESAEGGNSTQNQEQEHIPLADVIGILSEVTDLLSVADLKKKTSMATKLRLLGEKYRDAHKAYGARQYGRAEKLAGEALLELDLLRQQFKKIAKRPARANTAEIERPLE